MDTKNKYLIRENEAFENLESDLAKELVWGAVLLLGGFLTVFTLLFTNSKLGSPNALGILYFGCTVGMILTVIGAWGLGYFKNARRNR